MNNLQVNFACLACGAGEHKLFAVKRGYHVWQCANCRILFLYPVPKPEQAALIYGEDYFAGANQGFGYTEYDTDKAAMKPVFEKHLKHIEGLTTTGGKSLFDVGAATGYFMDIAKSRGWQVAGVEISDFAAGLGRKKGLDVKTGTLLSMPPETNKYNVVTMWDVIEHMPDPAGEVGRVHAMLKKGGLVAINTPDSGSLYARLLGSNWHLFVPPEHIWYFNRKSLAMLLEKNGFEVVEVGCVGKLFTVEYVLNMLYKWQKLSVWKRLEKMVMRNWIGRISVPINLRDNMFMLARKK